MIKEWFNDNKFLAYTIIGIVGILVTLIILAKFWSHAIVAVICLGVGFYYGRRNKKEGETKKIENREGFL